MSISDTDIDPIPAEREMLELKDVSAASETKLDFKKSANKVTDSEFFFWIYRKI